jgi:hypothetical protein
MNPAQRYDAEQRLRISIGHAHGLVRNSERLLDQHDAVDKARKQAVDPRGRRKLVAELAERRQELERLRAELAALPSETRQDPRAQALDVLHRAIEQLGNAYREAERLLDEPQRRRLGAAVRTEMHDVSPGLLVAIGATKPFKHSRASLRDLLDLQEVRQ